MKLAGSTMPLIAAGRLILRRSVALKREIAPPLGHRGRTRVPEPYSGAPAWALSPMRSELRAQLAPLNRYGLGALSAAVAQVLIATTRKSRRHEAK